MSSVTLLKYQGTGNDFLICLDPSPLGDEADALSRGLVLHLCDRHEGVGADGLILLRQSRAGGDGLMELYNADGTRAETSGNGLRCFALALVDSGIVPRRALTVETDGGLVNALVAPRTGRCADVVVEMGTVQVGEEAPSPPAAAGFRARTAEIGNPHLVLIGESLGGVDVGEIGPPLVGAVAGGQNVEVVAPDGRGGLDLVVFERGAGATRACGSGSCAAAAAARASGLVGDRVVVHNPGGDLVVQLAGPLARPSARLTGPACRVARVDYELETIAV